MKKIKPILPSLREKKRYLAFEIISENGELEQKSVVVSINRAVSRLFGLINQSRAGVMFLAEKYDAKKMRGIIKVNHNYLDELRAALAMIKEVDNKKVIFRSIGASGVIAKVDKYISGEA